MTQAEEVGPEGGVAQEPEWWRPASLLTPSASAVVGFTLAVLSMMGQGSWSMAVQSFFGTMFAPGDYNTILGVMGAASLAMAVSAIALGGRVLRAEPDHPGWDTQLARAAVLVGCLGALLGVITVLGAVFRAV